METIKEIAHNFGVEPALLTAQLLSFLIFGALLYIFAYKRILNVLDERRAKIAEGLANAEKIKLELNRTEAARQDILSRANSDASKMIEEARAAAARVQEAETQKAIAAAEQIIAKAREAAAQDHARMLAELKREIGRLVVEATTRVTGKVLNSEDQQRLIEETNRQIAA